LAISIATPWVSQSIFAKWFSFPNVILLLPIPIATLVLFGTIWRSLGRLPVRLAAGNEYGIGVPFGATVGIFLLAFYGLGYSIFPWLVIDKITIWQAASSPEALMVIFYGVAVVLPVIIAYTVFAYRIFWGKSTELKY
jgi:cytochrome d ubiquinol oxidase subunit II